MMAAPAMESPFFVNIFGWLNSPPVSRFFHMDNMPPAMEIPLGLAINFHLQSTKITTSRHMTNAQKPTRSALELVKSGIGILVLTSAMGEDAMAQRT